MFFPCSYLVPIWHTVKSANGHTIPTHRHPLGFTCNLTSWDYSTEWVVGDLLVGQCMHIAVLWGTQQVPVVNGRKGGYCHWYWVDNRHVWKITRGNCKIQRQVKRVSFREHEGLSCGHTFYDGFSSINSRFMWFCSQGGFALIWLQDASARLLSIFWFFSSFFQIWYAKGQDLHVQYFWSWVSVDIQVECLFLARLGGWMSSDPTLEVHVQECTMCNVHASCFGT